MWAYEVSGVEMLKHWFSYRRRDRSRHRMLRLARDFLSANIVCHQYMHPEMLRLARDLLSANIDVPPSP